MQSSSPNTSAGIHARGVTVRFGKNTAVNDATFTIAPGTITGLLGPNGAGKSTLAYALAGWRPLHAGTIELVDALGQPLQDHKVGCHDEVGTVWLSQQVTYTDAMGILIAERTIRENVGLLAQVRPSFNYDEFTDMLGHCDITLAARPKTLSTGKRAAVAMATALASNAPITIFDEATNGLDTQTRAYFLERLITAAAENTRTFVISSHYIGEFERIISDVLVIDAGAVRFNGAADDLRASLLTVAGRQEDVDRLLSTHEVLSANGPLSTSSLGVLGQATVRETGGIATAATASGLDVLPVSLEAAVTALTTQQPHTNTPASTNTPINTIGNSL